MFTFGGEIEHVATVERWERPGGVGDVQQRGTAFALTGKERNSKAKTEKTTSNTSYCKWESGHFSGRIIKITESL